MLTRDQIHRIMPHAPMERIDKFLAPLYKAMVRYAIDTPLRQAHFLAQIAHESEELLYVEEIDSGEEYEGRKDLGNTLPGDGIRFKGRGLIQITGRANYKACGAAIGVDLIKNPELLEIPEFACTSAAWFWATHSLNTLADEEKLKEITRRINGGYNGIEHRAKYLANAYRVLVPDL